MSLQKLDLFQEDDIQTQYRKELGKQMAEKYEALLAAEILNVPADVYTNYIRPLVDLYNISVHHALIAYRRSSEFILPRPGSTGVEALIKHTFPEEFI